TRIIAINRAPVLTLWVAVVAQRLGFAAEEALTLGKSVAGLNAQAKGRRLGIFKPHEEKAKEAREKGRGERFWIEVLGRPGPATNTEDGIRAVRGGKPIDPDNVRRYLEGKFGENLKVVRSAMQRLSRAYRPQELAHNAYRLYERFRPDIPAGKKGRTRAISTWGGRLLLVVTSSWPVLTGFCPSATSSAGWGTWWPVSSPSAFRSSALLALP